MAFIKLQGKTVFRTPLPVTIPGLQLWLDSADPTTLYDSDVGGSLVTTDGSAIARWEDKSGKGRHLTQPIVNKRPVLKTGIKNGKNVLEFDGVDDNMSLLNGFANSSNSTFAFMVFRHNSVVQNGSAAYRLANISFNGTNNRCYMGSGSSWSNIIGGNFGDISWNANNALRTTQAVTLDWFNMGFGRNNDADAQIWLNGVLRASGTPNNGESTTQYVSIGGSDAPNITYLNGYIAEFIIYSAPLETQDRENIENYLNEKWSIY